MTESGFALINTGSGNRFPIAGSMLVGRQADCDLQVQQGLPSRRHAQLHVQPDGVWVEDLNSANGTFVNGVRIQEKTLLKAGDRVRFDVEEFEFQAVAATADPVDGATLYRKPETPQAPAESGVYKRPPAWVDQALPDDGANKTKFIDPEALKAMRAAHPVNVRTGEVRVPCLVVQSGGKANMRIELRPTASGVQEWTIGSDAERAIVLNDPGVSALHAKIVNEGERWKLIDQMSANGTFVNDRRSNASFLSPGDRLRFGPVECIFDAPVATARPQLAPASSAGSGSRKKVVLIGAAVAVAAIAAFFALRVM